jgi:hypothetical protein
MLIWTVAAAVIVSVVKQILIYTPGLRGVREWSQVAMEGTILAIVTLAAMWMVLGSGRVVPKTVVALLIAASAGGCLWFIDRQFKNFVNPAIVFWLPQVGPWWIGWTLLAEPFLAGLLLVFQTTEYRLVRHRRVAG